MKLKHVIIGVVGIVATGMVASSTLNVSGCHYLGNVPSNVFPDSKCTPGMIDPTLNKQKLCDPSFRTGTVRSVSQEEKDRVAKEYGLTSLRGYEIDHLISLELGGSNDIQNLWPELGFPNPKDQVENICHKEVCAGKITLEEAQKEISTNWTTACK